MHLLLCLTGSLLLRFSYNAPRLELKENGFEYFFGEEGGS